MVSPWRKTNEAQSNADELGDELLSQGDKVEGDSQSDDAIDEIIRDLFPIYHGLTEQDADLGSSSDGNLVEEHNDDAKKFCRLLKDFG